MKEGVFARLPEHAEAISTDNKAISCRRYFEGIAAPRPFDNVRWLAKT
jgi:hypothetical protein